MPPILTRRRLLTTISMAGAAGLIRAPYALAGEDGLETTSIRIFANRPGICVAPQYIAEPLLRAEGFTDVRFVGLTATTGAPAAQAVGAGNADFTVSFAAPLAIAIDGGVPITLLSGVHVGCFELFGNESVRSITDLKGKSMGVQGFGSSQHVYAASMVAYVGLDPTKDIRWVINPMVKPTEMYEKGEIDAFLGFPPEPQDLRARHIGHVVVNSAVDRPWSQYFCCMLAGNREFVRKYPIATKRVLRAILKAADLCVSDPQNVAKQLVDEGFTDRYDYALQTLGELPYDKWREYEPEDTIRFYALRLHEVGMIKSSPQKIIADGTDWRFLNELKRELKA